jgi:DNA-binding CsgD family transcriptional regulator
MMITPDSRDIFVRKTGIILSIIFFCAAIVSFIGSWVNYYPNIASIFTQPNYIITFAMSGLMLVSARVKQVEFVQPVVFLAGAVIGIMDSYLGFYGLGFFCIAVLILFRQGFYERHRVFRFVASLVFFYALELASALKSGDTLYHTFTPLFFITVFLLMLYLAFEEKLLVYLKEPREKLSLSEAKLSETEKRYVLECVGGKQPKAIAADHKLSESTGRNTLANAYKKLKVNDRSELMALSAKYDIVA